VKPVFAELHIFDDPEPRSAALNMAIDEALLERISSPSIRFYRWAKPSLSFGYFCAFSDVEHESRRDIVRRWTGGGIVLHGTDVTYSVILPSKNRRRLQSSRSVYAEVHEAIRRVLAKQAFVRLAAQDAPKVSAACFANPVVADVLVNGRKIAGAAQRRSRTGLLHQGSIQYDELPRDFRRAFVAELCDHSVLQFVSAEILQCAEQLAIEKYGTDAWSRRR
jgi:lipoyl(octanoyl) transferase